MIALFIIADSSGLIFTNKFKVSFAIVICIRLSAIVINVLMLNAGNNWLPIVVDPSRNRCL